MTAMPVCTPWQPQNVAIDPYAVRVLLDTDRLYFELGAKRSSASGLDLVYMDGHLRSPSGAAIWGVDRQCKTDEFGKMLIAAEAELHELGGRVMRVYVEDPAPQQLTAAFAQLRYRSRVELALMADLPVSVRAGELNPDFTMVEVKTVQQWLTKQSLHAGEQGQPDGYVLSAAEWVELERKKCETGGMSCYLVYSGSDVVATVALIRDRGIARLKNLYVGFEHRQRGVGITTVRLLANEASALGYRKFGCFVVEGGKAFGVYKRAGLRIVSSVTEFSKQLAP